MKSLRHCAMLLLLATTFVLPLAAQPQLDIQEVKADNFPTMQLHVAVRQNQVLRRDIDSSMFLLREDGLMQTPLRLTFPPAQRSFSVTIVVGVGSAMSANDIAVARGIATRLIDRLDGVADDAAIVAYDGNATVRQDWTHIKAMLQIGIDGLQPTGGNNHIWNGAYEGVLTGLSGTHPDRAVIFISNGKGDGGTKDVPDVINLAKNRIKVHCYGVNAVNTDQLMRQLATETGGRYYTNADLLVQEVIDELSGRPQYGVLEYTTNNLCRDGRERDLSLRYRNGNDSVTTTTQPMLDAGATTQVAIKVDTTSITAGATKSIGLRITPSVQGQRFYGGTIQLAFDTTKLKLTGATTTGTLLAGTTVQTDMLANGGTISVSGSVLLNGTGNLLLLEFKAGEVSTNTDVAVSIGDVNFDRGCLDVQTLASRITVRPRSAALTISSAPVIFNWGPNGYTPNPAVVAVDVTNTGDVPVGALTARLASSPDVRIAYGAVSDVTVVPDILQPGQKGTATFFVQAIPQSSEKTAQVGVMVNGDVTARNGILYFNIKTATSAVATNGRCDAISVQGGAHTPWPATVTGVVRSAGSQTGPTGTVRIDAPNELTLVAGNATQNFAAMATDDSTVLTWQFEYPRDAAATYHIALITEVAGMEPDTTWTQLEVPELVAAQIELSCGIVPDRLNWNPNTGTYSPDETQVQLTVRNVGSAASEPLQATIVLPSGVVLSSGSEPLVVNVPAIAPGTHEVVNWRLQPMPVCEDMQYDIDLSVRSTTMTPVICTGQLFVQSSNSAAPVLTAQLPATLDTVDTNAEVTFVVTASDPDKDLLRYVWSVNGAEEPMTLDSTFTHTFSSIGNYTVRCAILDGCAEGGSGDTTFATWQFSVRDPLDVLDLATARSFAILGNYPNPFNPGTVISFTLPDGARHARLEVLDVHGRVLRTLVDEVRHGGVQQVRFDAGDLPAGVYHARLLVGGAVRVHRMVLVK